MTHASENGETATHFQRGAMRNALAEKERLKTLLTEQEVKSHTSIERAKESERKRERKQKRERERKECVEG